MTRYLIIGVLTLFILYGLVEAYPLLAGPSLSIDSPKNDTSFNDGVVSIKGSAERIATLTLNDAPLPHNEEGLFDTTLTFPRGGSILTFRATDRFGRQISTTRNIYVP